MNEKNNAVNQAGRHTSAPSPAAGFEVLLITGMSGAGRSHAANSIEDMGWYVVDNMPATRCSSSATNPCAGPIRCSRAIV